MNRFLPLIAAAFLFAASTFTSPAVAQPQTLAEQAAHRFELRVEILQIHADLLVEAFKAGTHNIGQVKDQLTRSMCDLGLTEEIFAEIRFGQTDKLRDTLMPKNITRCPGDDGAVATKLREMMRGGSR